MRGLIIAAGAGSRLKALGGLKPLVQLAGRPIIEHVVRLSRHAGLDGLVVVTGYKAELLEPVLHEIAARCRLPITIVRNPRWESGNGTSVLSAAPLLKDPFILLMADHLFQPDMLEGLVEAGRRSHGVDVLLAVDRKLDNPLVDLNDVTRVQCIADRIAQLGKCLPLYNAYDCGLFWCVPALFKSLELAIEHGKFGLSDGVQHVADTTRRAYVHDIGNRLWIDVDDDAAWARAEAAIAAGMLLPDRDGSEIGVGTGPSGS